MLTFDVKPLLKSLEDFRTVNETKMKGMVRSFVMDVTQTAISYTPLGDSTVYFSLYQKRDTDWIWQSYGLQPVEGFARGSWRVTLDSSLALQENYGRNSGDAALRQANFGIRSYDLGQPIEISNYGPYIRDLNKNSSPQTQGQGIVAPTVDSVIRIASISLKNYYDKVTA